MGKRVWFQPIVGAVVLSVAAGAAGCASGDDAVPVQAEKVAKQARALVGTVPKTPDAIFRANCQSCHGDKGQGGTSWIDPSQSAFAIAGRQIRSIKQWVRQGRVPEMPAFHEMEISDGELDALASYVNGLPDSYVPPPAYQHTVVIRDEDPWFYPAQLRVEPGETVRYINEGKTWHPVTQLQYVASMGNEGTDAGLLGPGGEYYRTFDDPVGDYTFLCKIHPYMRNQVFVGTNVVPPSPTRMSPQALPTLGGTGEIWVLAQFQDYPGKAKDGVIQVIDAASWTVTHVIPAGNNPHNIWFKPGGTSAIITNWFDSTLTEVDSTTKTVLRDILAGASPAHVTSDYDGNTFYVSMEGSRYVQPFDGRNMRRKSQIGRVTGYGPHGIWYGGGKLMTSNSLDNTVTFLNANTLSEIATLPAGLYPLGASLNSSGTRGYAGNCLDGTVSAYDLSGATPVKMTDIYIGGCPVQTPITPDDRYAVVPNSPYTTVIDTATNTIAAQFVTGSGAHGAAFSRTADNSGWYAYVTHKTQNYLSVIYLPDSPTGTINHAGDVPLVTTTVDKVSPFGYTDTGGNGIATRPLPAPWL